MDAQRPIPRLWIRSAEVGGGVGGGHLGQITMSSCQSFN